MDGDTYEYLLNKERGKIAKLDTQMGQSISAEERLSSTLRFLATGK